MPRGLAPRLFTKLTQESIAIHITMEATGVYHEHLAYDLAEVSNVIVHILLPNLAKKYFESLNVKVKTDKVDSEILARLGLERQLHASIHSANGLKKSEFRQKNRVKPACRARGRRVGRHGILKNKLKV